MEEAGGLYVMTLYWVTTNVTTQDQIWYLCLQGQLRWENLKLLLEENRILL